MNKTRIEKNSNNIILNFIHYCSFREKDLQQSLNIYPTENRVSGFMPPSANPDNDGKLSG